MENQKQAQNRTEPQRLELKLKATQKWGHPIKDFCQISATCSWIIELKEVMSLILKVS